MSKETVDIFCPNCSVSCAASIPPDVRPGPEFSFSRIESEAEIVCLTCGWEFVVVSSGIYDEGEPEPEAELEIDSDGNLIEAELDFEFFPPWHGIASLNGDVRNWRGWRDYCADPYDLEEDDYGDSRLDRRCSATCPNCRHHFREVWLGEIRCPTCDWVFRVDHEPNYDEEDEDYDEEGGFDPSRDEPKDGRILRPLIVSPSGQGDFTTIREAFEHAETTPGRRIFVRPGLYEENITLNNPVEIVGDGPREQIIVGGPENAGFTVADANSIVSGLTLCSLDNSQNLPVLELRQGLVENCAITSASSICVRMYGGTLRNCQIHDGEKVGIHAAGGSIEKCDIFHNGGAGILVRANDSPLIKQCKIHHGHAEGIVVQKGGQATLVECDIYANARSGVRLEGDRTLLWKCRIHDGESDGIRIVDGVGLVERCEIFANARMGMCIVEGNVYAWRSHFRDGRGLGIGMSGPGVFDLRRCSIRNNARAGIGVGARAEPIIRRCRICANYQSEKGFQSEPEA